MAQYALPLLARRPLDNYQRFKRFKAETQFIAVKPDASTAERIERFCEQFIVEQELAGTQIDAPRLHITLQGMGQYDASSDPFVVETMNRIAKEVTGAPFEVTLDTVMTFKGSPSVAGRPSWAPLVLLARSEALQELRRTLGAAVRKFGLQAERSFKAHVTVLYGPNVVLEQPIEPIRFLVEEFVLVHSLVGKSKHRTMGCWPLNGGTPAPDTTGLLL